MSISRRGTSANRCRGAWIRLVAHMLAERQHVAIAVNQKDAASKPMMTYIGTPTSRVDGRAKVTGAAKYAAEFNAARPRPCAASSHPPSPKAASLRIDASEALRVDGVIDVLTHENRPHMADTDQRLQGRCGAARRLAVPAALRRQDHVQRPADRAGRRRRAGDRALRGVAGARRIRRRSARHGRVPPARRRRIGIRQTG